MTIPITIQPEWKVTVDEGAALELDTVIAKAKSEVSEDKNYPVSETLGFPPDKIFKHLKKMIGEEVQEGEVIAESDGILSSKKFLSDSQGVIVGISHETGIVTVRESVAGAAENIYSLLIGTVATKEKSQLTIEVGKVGEADIEQALSSRIGGRVLRLSETDVEIVTIKTVRDAVVISQSLSAYAVAKLEALQATAILTEEDYGPDLKGLKTDMCIYGEPEKKVLYVYEVK